MKHWLIMLGVALGGLVGGGCALNVRHSVPEPIHITVDVNVRVEKALADFFDEIDAQPE